VHRQDTCLQVCPYICGMSFEIPLQTPLPSPPHIRLTLLYIGYCHRTYSIQKGKVRLLGSRIIKALYVLHVILSTQYCGYPE
jgi:hypothetical protein